MTDPLFDDWTTPATLDASLSYTTPVSNSATYTTPYEYAHLSTIHSPPKASPPYFDELDSTQNGFQGPPTLDPRMLNAALSNQLLISPTLSARSAPSVLPNFDWSTSFGASSPETERSDAEPHMRRQENASTTLTFSSTKKRNRSSKTFASCRSNRHSHPECTRVRMNNKPFDCWRQIQLRHVLEQKKKHISRQRRNSKKDNPQVICQDWVDGDPEKNFYCLCCETGMKNVNDLIRHTGKHLNIGLKCPNELCSRAFTREDPLKRHLKRECLSACKEKYGKNWMRNLARNILGEKMYKECTLLFHKNLHFCNSPLIFQGRMLNDRSLAIIAYRSVVSLKM